jgi:hypothetical protein
MRLGLVHRRQLAARDGRGGHGGDAHVRQARVDAELGCAVHLGRRIEARMVLPISTNEPGSFSATFFGKSSFEAASTSSPKCARGSGRS